MTGKEKLSHRSPAADSAGANKYALWRSLVRELLATRWQQAPVDTGSIAGTVVGMFDAGATEQEVAAFLVSEELSQGDEPWLSDSARMALVRDLHQSERSSSPTRSSDEEMRLP